MSQETNTLLPTRVVRWLIRHCLIGTSYNEYFHSDLVARITSTPTDDPLPKGCSSDLTRKGLPIFGRELGIKFQHDLRVL
jgi:hypothetical protein